MARSDLMDDLKRDVAFAARQIFSHPAFTAVAVATIALAIGATTAIFSVVDGIMLRPLPYEDPDELVMVWMDYTERDVVLPDKRREWLSWPNFADFRDEVEAVDCDKASRVARLMFHLGYEVAQTPERPAWTEDGRALLAEMDTGEG